MIRFLNKLYALATLLALNFAASPALADTNVGHNWQIGFHEAVTSSAERIHHFHDLLLYIISAIVLFVFVLLLIVAVRFNEKANPKPSKTTHNVMLEIVWTLIPFLILVVISVPSFKLLYKNDRIANPEMTLKITGNQWYWEYEYPDNGGVSFASNMLPEDQIDPAKGQVRLLSTDAPVYLPIDTDISILVTSPLTGVIHSWTVQPFGVKMDAVPGRTNETWFNIEKTGTYYGQCSELCGKDHAFMPIEIHAVTRKEFNDWIVKQGGKALPVKKDEKQAAKKILIPSG